MSEWVRRLGAGYLTGIRASQCRLGMYIGEEAALQRGVGAQAEFLLLERVFREMNLETLRAEVFAANPGVVGFHQQFGFEIEGVRRVEVPRTGSLEDVVDLILKNRRWNELRGAIWGRLRRKDDRFSD